MPSGTPRILIVLTHRPTVDWFAALSRALERRGAEVFFLSTDYSLQSAAGRRGCRAPNVMHARLTDPAPAPAPAPPGVSLEDVVRFYLADPALRGDAGAIVAQAGRIVRAFAAHFDRVRPDLVIGWNGTTPIERAAMKLAESRGLRTLYFELGNFPGRIVADPKGVNREGSMPGLALPREFDRGRIESWLRAWTSRGPAKRSARNLRRALGHVLMDGAVNSLVRRSPFHPSHYFEHERRLAPERFAKRLARFIALRLTGRAASAERPALPEKFIFVPLQVHDDTQVLIHSPRVPTMEKLVDLVAAAMPPGFDFVVKAHPADEGRRGYDAVEKALSRPGMHFLRSGDTAEIIRRAAAVVTLNSTVGLEALAFMKPVVVLGDALYSGRGITLDVADPADLPAKLREAVAFRPDPDEIERFLDGFIFEYLKPGSLANPRPGDADVVADYALSLLAGGAAAKADPPVVPGLVSVIMPAWNAERFIAGAIRSVLAQTRANWELIVVDDGSTDRTGEVVRSFSDPRICYQRTENRGTAAARNTGIAESRGEFVAFLDNDDAWLPRKLELQVKELERSPESALVYTDLRLVDGEGRRLPSHRLPLSRRPAGRCLEKLLVRNDIRAPSSVMARRSALEAAGRFREELSGADDWDLWLRLAPLGEFAFIPEALVAYRVSAGQQSDRYEMMNRHAREAIERAYARAEVRRAVAPRRLARLRRKAEAALLYDEGWRALRAGDASRAVKALAASMRSALYDVRQPAMLLAALVARLAPGSRKNLLAATRK